MLIIKIKFKLKTHRDITMNKKFSGFSSGSKGAGDNIEQINSELECLEVTLSPFEYK